MTYVSVKASSIVAQLNPWDIDGSVERLKERLRPLYEEAAKRSPNVFINLDMEEYHDLHLTIRLFKELLSEPEFKELEAGIVLQAYLPDTFAALQELAGRGFREVILWVLEGNCHARRFYERAGFVPTGETLADTIGKRPVRELCYRYVLPAEEK